ncbi:hypothetical protein EUV02_03865 [Polymorphobacter arshaanensis]|uniref:DNA-binding protein n=1 Tax=Glacieibacterium arshaanense TaxID=2511025 RepID=A0A4Y9ESH9_9SPHN|nr:hypothetical protein [Polymorphobacter arshaanensis]TFU06159.1 hypothetical protein EUV02_03865 [Polymorphobacter arshaanensis]
MTNDNEPDDAYTSEELALGLIVNTELARQAGGLLEVGEVMRILGIKTHQEIYQAVSDRKVLAVQDGPMRRYPAFQFVAGQVHPGVVAVLKAIPDTDGWDVLDYLYSLEEGIGTIRPVDLIQKDQAGIDKAVRFARRLES